MLNIFKKNQKPKGEEVVYKIDGMHCTSCSMNIDGALEDLDGVFESTTSYAKSTTKVVFDAKKIGEVEIKKVIVESGYTIS